MANWQQFNVELAAALDPLGEGLSNTVGGIAGILQAGLSVLNVLSSFLTVTQSPLLAGVETLRGEILNLLQDLQESGVYGLFLVPDTLEEFVQYRGGYGKFRQLFLESLNDPEDPDRPQIPTTGALGGLFLYLESEDPASLIVNTQRLYSFFSRPFNLSYPKPINLTVKRVDSTEGVVTPLLEVFTGDANPPDSLFFEWQEPRYANDVLLDVYAGVKFLLERSKSRDGILRVQSDLSAPQKTPLEKSAARSGKSKTSRQPVTNSEGEPLYYWEPVDPADPFVELNDLVDVTDGAISDFNFLAGSYSYQLEGVPKGLDNGYYYRVRAVPKEAVLEPLVVRGFVDNKEQDITVYILTDDKGQPLDPKLSPASAPVLGYLPDVDTTFDLPTALLNTYRTAYLLRFDEDLLKPNGSLAVGSSSLREPLPDVLFTTTAGTLAYEDPDGEETLYYPDPIFADEILNFTDSAASLRNERVADVNSFSAFGGVDEFILPRTSLPGSDRIRLAIDRLAEDRVRKVLPTVATNEGLFETFRQFYLSSQVEIESVLTNGVSEFTLTGGNDIRFRVDQILQLVVGFSRLGSPPNWENVKLLDDLFPEGSEAINRLFDLIKAFESVFQDSVSELQSTITGVEDRLAVLNALLDTIDDLIDSLTAYLQLDFDINLLYIPPAVGGNSYIISEFLNAQNAPDGNPNAYFVAISLLAGGASLQDLTAIQNVFSLIFGV